MKLNFMAYRKLSYLLSLSLVILSLTFLSFKGLNLGLDFTGGNLLEVKFNSKVKEEEVKALIKGAVVQSTREGSLLIKFRQGFGEVERKLKSLGDYQILRKERIGSIISKELRRRAVLALATALVGIALYLGFRFGVAWSLGGLIALFHDVLIVLGAYSLTYREVNLEVVSSLLIVAGYSVADTVVIYDRIRETLRVRRGLSLEEVINLSVNSTLSRTLMTSLTTLVVSLALFLFGGQMLSNIVFAFVVGIIVGTYSSIFVASALVLDSYRIPLLSSLLLKTQT